jgi:ribosome recycling factor
MFSIFRRLLFVPAQRFPSRGFSWKSRLNRDPELRQRKLEILNKRYLLRRLDALENEDHATSGGVIVQQTRDLVEQKLTTLSNRVSKLANLSSIDKEELEEVDCGGGTSLKTLTISVSQSSPRSAIIIVKDKGNTERLFKQLKREFPNLTVTMMDRERIALRVPTITEDLRERRGEMVDKLITDSRKELKKLELQTYNEIKKQMSDRELLAIRERIRSVFDAAEKDLDSTLKTAMDELEIDFR